MSIGSIEFSFRKILLFSMPVRVKTLLMRTVPVLAALLASFALSVHSADPTKHALSASSADQKKLTQQKELTEQKKPIRMPGPMRFSEYTGNDKLDWETSSGALADTSYELPVYKTWPSRPYALVGEIYHLNERQEWREGEIKDAVKGAQRVGGEAIIIRLISESGVGALTGRSGGLPIGTGLMARTTALVIRWQTEEEKQTRKERDDRLRKQLMAENPNLGINNETAALVIKYLLQSEEGEVSKDFGDRYKTLMLRISSASSAALSGDWIFKGVIKEKGLVAEKENQFLGLASVKADGEDLAIVSTEGKVEMNFSGQNAKGRVTGQIAAMGLSSKAEGVALEDKISLSFQMLTPNGTAQGVVVLQRNRVAPVESKPKFQNL